mgnify:CR=1 FL=1
MSRLPLAATLRRAALQAAPTLAGIVVLNFLLLKLAPGDAADVLAAESGFATEETMSALRQFAADLELWMDANNRFAQDGSLLQQVAWRTQVQQALDQSAASAWTLAQVGPAPNEYAAIDSMLELIYSETQTLRANFHAHFFERFDLGKQRFGVDDHAVAENGNRLRVYNAGGNEMQFE